MSFLPASFSPADIADAMAAGLAQEAAARDAEQSPLGLDALDERALHPLLAAGLRAHGFGAALEQRYPAARSTRARSRGERCDLVVTPRGAPPCVEEEFPPPPAPDLTPDLFSFADAKPAPVTAVPLDQALWIEVKTARVFHADGPNPRYAAELLGAPSEDVVRLGTAEGVRHGMLALVVFARAEEDGRAHLAQWEATARAEGLPLDVPRVRCVPIADRIGHAACMVAVAEVGRIG